MRWMSRLGTLGLLGAMLGLTACASYPDAAHPVSAGWRVARIDHEVGLDESVPMVAFNEDCRYGVSTPSARWVLVHYRHPPGELYRVVPWPEAGTVKADDEVYVNVAECDRALEPRQAVGGKP